MPKLKKIKVVVGKLIKPCPGKRHGWFESNVGRIRKPISANPSAHA